MSEFDPSLPCAAVAAEASPAAPEPWEAVGWGLVYAGFGQLHLGRVARGAGFILAALAGSVSAIVLLVRPGVPVAAAAAPFAIAVAAQIWGVVDAFRLAAALETPEQTATRRSQRDAWKALLLTRFFPGAGHLYEGRVTIGFGFVLAGLVAGVLPVVGNFAGTYVLVPLASYELWRGFRGRAVGPAVRMWTLVGAGLVSGLVVIAVTLALRTYVVSAYRCPSEGMTPTLAVGDLFFADMSRRGRADIGDVVVFPYPAKPTEDFVKRVAGVAGDTLEFRRDGMWRNGRLAIRPPVLTPEGLEPPPLAGEGNPYVVPPGQVFVIGDNLQNSMDSRYFGAVPVASVHGRALKTYWPPAHQGAIREMPGAVQ